jgi:uncharacterized protein (TIGR02145 family)
MKKKTNLFPSEWLSRAGIYTLAIIAMILMLANGCKKDEDKTPVSASEIIFNPNLTYGTVSDIDGNIYKTITIGTQTWMAENLKVTKYRDGTSILNVKDNTAWGNLTTGAYCDINNTVSNSTIYGKLYNWFAVNNSRNIAPTGWHVPTDAEWTILTTYLGGENVAGGKLKETGVMHWKSPNTGATNETGFTALPGGNRIIIGEFYYIGYEGFWWSSTEDGTGGTYRRCINYSDSGVVRDSCIQVGGFSVRCLRDN